MIKLKNGKEWLLNTAYHGDCLEFMRLLPDKCIDLCLTDPPYGIDITKMNMGGRKTVTPDKSKTWDKKTPTADFWHELFRVSKNQIIWGGNYFPMKESRCWLVWDKGPTLKGRDFAEAELAWTSFDKVVRVFVVNPNQHDRIHPTQKPLKLIKWCIENYMKTDGIIFDPFLGSFTTAVAAYHYGLPWIGCEKDDDYFRDGLKRYENEALQQMLF